MTPASGGEPGIVLVVDDDSAVRNLVALALRRAGFDVVEADNGPSALQVVEAQGVGIVVMDMGMPGMSGTQVIEALRGRPDTATLPVILMTGSGDQFSVIQGLGAGANDFLAKPVRLDELVARVRAHLRVQEAWSLVVQEELRARQNVVAALGALRLSPVPEEAAAAIVAELAKRTDTDFVGVTQLAQGDRLLELATYNRVAGVRRGGSALGPTLARDLVDRARSGPWIEEILPLDADVRTDAFAMAELEIAAGAAIYDGDELVGLLTLGVARGAEPAGPVRKAGLLAAAIDFASVLSAVAGSAIADWRDVTARHAWLDRELTDARFHPVFQPIVELDSRTIVGYEALTRFDDGTAPNVRFAEAANAGLGHDYELATLEAAIREADHLPVGAFLSLNVSPGLALEGGRRFQELVRGATRPLVLELTEHAQIEDYEALRQAIGTLGDVGLAVDDAGAGYASLRHILELRPMFAKIDISLVRGIDGDELRQALAAGLEYYAMRTGCRLIAEGVETTAEADALQRLGIDYGQGYLFGRPERVSG